MTPKNLLILQMMKKYGLKEKAEKIFKDLKSKGYSSTYDETGLIGKRYRRQDENGTPWCLTIDYDTLKDETVTLRNRDTMEQKRIDFSNIADIQG